MKRNFVLLAFFVLLASSLPASSGIPAKMGIELTGGAIMLNPADFDKDYKRLVDIAFPITGAGNSLFVGMAPSGSGTFEYLINPNLAILAKGAFMFAEDDASYQNENGEELWFNHAAFSIGYFGVGGKYYMGMDDAAKFFLSVGADVGMFLPVQAFWEFGTDPDKAPANSTSDYNSLDFKDSFFGANIELGAKYFMTESFALGLNIGYRIASMPINYPDKAPWNMEVAGEKFFAAQKIDFSGMTFGAGLSYYFGDSAATTAKGKKGKAGKAASGAISQNEKYGDYYFKAKNYSYALKYYNAALKKDPKNAGLYKKIGFCYYYMKQPAYAKRYLQYYLRLNPEDAQVKAWIQRLK